MPWRDIPAFVHEHLHAETGHDVTRSILELLILTACRSGEVRGMTREEIDFRQAVGPFR